MEKPKCRLCGDRHYQNEPHKWEKVEKTVRVGGVPVKDVVAPAEVEPGVIEKIAALAEKELVPVGVGALAAANISGISGPNLTGTIDWSKCPHCEERKRKKREAMKRYRGKK